MAIRQQLLSILQVNEM